MIVYCRGCGHAGESTEPGAVWCPLCEPAPRRSSPGSARQKRASALPRRAAPVIRLTGPTFCAAVLLRAGRVYHAAPILHYMRGWTAGRVQAYACGRGWEVEEWP